MVMKDMSSVEEPANGVVEAEKNLSLEKVGDNSDTTALNGTNVVLKDDLSR